MEPREENDQLDEHEEPTGYKLGEGRTMKDVLDTQAELLESEGLKPAWKQEHDDSK